MSDERWLRVAYEVAAHSLCVREQVGAVIISAHGDMIAGTWNGPPAGFDHGGLRCDTWCARARPAFEWRPSGDDSLPLNVRTDGDLLVDEDTGRVVDDPYLFYTSRGYVKVEDLSPDYSDCPSLHAEANALSVCDRTQREGGVIYVTSHVCHACAKLVANSGLSTVVIPSDDGFGAAHRRPERSYELLERCGVDVVTV